MISKEELFLKAHNRQISLIEFKKATLDILLSGDADSFLDFARKRDLGVFYCFSYLSPSKVIINGDTLSDADGNTMHVLRDLCPNLVDLDWYLDDLIAGTADESDPDYPGNTVGFTESEKRLCRAFLAHNETVDLSLLDRPIALQMFVILQGKTIGISETDNWYEGSEDTSFSNQALASILDSFREDIEQAQQRKQEKQEEAEEWLKHYLMADDNFFLCSNKQMRARFGEQLWRKPELRHIRPVFTSRFGGIDPSFYDTLERVYKQFKNKR